MQINFADKLGYYSRMKNKNLIFFPLLLVLYELTTYLTNDAYLPALPNIVHDLATSQHLVQWTLTAWFMGTASLQLILGPVSDRYGRRPVLLIGGLIFVISSTVCTFATNITVLLIFRFIQGATLTSMIVAGYATIHELFEHKTAIHTLAWMFSITVLAPAVGPLFGAAILYFTSWRWIFGILTIWGALVVSLLFFNMPETNPYKEKNRINIKKIAREYKDILFNLDYIRPTLAYCCLFAALIIWVVAGPFLVIETFSRSAFEFGIYQVIIFGSYILGTRLVKPIMKKYDAPYLIKIGLSIALVGGLISLITFIYTNALFIIIISFALTAFSSGFASPSLNRTAMEASNRPMGVKVAVYSSLMSICGFLASAVISSIYNNTLTALAIMLIILTAISFLMGCGVRGFGVKT